MSSSVNNVVDETAGAGGVTADAELYTRSAILSWANEVLTASYSAFSEVPAKDLALLLYAVLHDQPGCECVTLHSIDFSADPTSIARLRNAQHVLAMLQQLSDSVARVDEAEVATLHLSPQLTATAWLEGRAFVDELRVWRWLRTKAHTLNVCVTDLQVRIHTFLHPDTSCAPDMAIGVKRPKFCLHDVVDDVAEGQAEATGWRAQKEARAEATPMVPCPVRDNDRAAAAVGDRATSDAAAHYHALAAAKATLQVALSASHSAAEATAMEDGTGTENKENVPSDTLPTSRLAGHLQPVTPGATIGCKRCPPLIAYALQSNLTLIDELERTRRRAIAACLKKDAIELLRALSSFP